MIKVVFNVEREIDKKSFNTFEREGTEIFHQMKILIRSSNLELFQKIIH